MVDVKKPGMHCVFQKCKEKRPDDKQGKRRHHVCRVCQTQNQKESRRCRISDQAQVVICFGLCDFEDHLFHGSFLVFGWYYF
ncbi:hypothetical protein MNB_SV-13-383 [hydrothermal vent metagenome]|uniref:Uncharacterized protein n=1 Tax=hydrothermal vent metagenome TaxID=652676 RepID=A0A1W1BL00_9ZZZZ